jgi:hypothetical protein
MEASINGVGAAGVPPRRPELEPKPRAPERAPRAVEGAPAPVSELAAWFDRNGDGRIDKTTWVLGGDAYLRVDKHVSELLDRNVVRPRDQLARATEAAVNAYRKYGATPPHDATSRPQRPSSS